MTDTPLLCGLLLTVVTTTAAQPAIDAVNLTDAHVGAAIDAIVAEIDQRRHPTRFWEPKTLPTGESRQTGGYTALTVLALLHAGRTYQDPTLRDAVAYLEQVEIDGTYARAVRAHVWAMLPPKFQDLLAADTRWLLDGFSRKSGGWTYRQQPGSSRRDNSITQYGALALWEAAKRGTTVEAPTWRILEDRFLSMQLADGGWNYKGDGPATGSMTAAGLTALFITQDLLHSRAYAAPALRQPPPAHEAIINGLEWLRENFSATENPGRDEYFFYYLYGVERVGLASGYKHLGDHDWFREGAAEVIRRLCHRDPKTGRMTIHQTIGGDGRAARVRLAQLDFALLFLSRGRVPVAINKLQAPGVAWNNRPRDVANLTQWLADDLESSLNWQIVDIRTDPKDWLDAPVLYFASNEGLPWTSGSAELESIERYLNLGGLLFAVNESKTSAFTKSLEKVGELLFPDAEWRTLSADHWAYTLLWPIGRNKPPLRALSNGVRELMIIAPATDFSGSFQLHDTSARSLYRTAAHLYLHASEMNRPRPRLGGARPTRPDRSSTGVAVLRHDSVRIGAPTRLLRARHRGQWNAEPLGLPGAVARLGATPTTIEVLELPLAEINTSKAPLTIVSGIDPPQFDRKELEAIKSYVEAGGTILFETAGGLGPFAAECERLLGTLLGVSGGPRSLLNDPIISAAGLDGAVRLTRIEYRPYALEAFGSRETTPRLRGFMIDDRPRVLFSREDLSHAWLDQPCWGVSGYAPDAARDLLGNIILSALAGLPGP